MKQSTASALLAAYNSLQEIVVKLYNEFQKAIENKDDADASLLEARAEILFEQAPGNNSCFGGATKWIESKHLP